MKASVAETLAQQALAIMRQPLDPFHDEVHVTAVWKTAAHIIRKEKLQLSPKELQHIKLASLWHDTSRKLLKTNVFLQPFLDGPISAWLFTQAARKLQVAEDEIVSVTRAITDHEEYFGYFPQRKKGLLAQLLTDADRVEDFSPVRVLRALEKTERRLFSRLLFNIYALGVPMLISNSPGMTFHFQAGEKKAQAYQGRLKITFGQHKQRFAQQLYGWNYRRLTTTLERFFSFK